MNIDIATLLLGGGQGKTKGIPLADGDFSFALDDKLVALAHLFPDIEPQAQAAALPAGMAPPAAVEAPVADGEWLNEPASAAERLAGAMSAEGEMETSDNPQWQLQQLVVRSVTGRESAARPPLAEPVGNAANSKTTGQRVQPEAPLAVTDKSPVINTAASQPQSQLQSLSQPQAQAQTPTAQAVPAASELITVAEPTASAVAVPAAVRTSVAHASQQVVTVNHPPETPEWKQSVSQQIAIFSRNGLHSAEIRLHPEELGSLHISLRMQHDQAQIHIVSDHAHVRQMMEHAMPQLRTAMADSGIQLGQANVSADSQYAAGEQGENGGGEQQNQSEAEDNPVENDIVPTLLTTTPGNIYGINTFA